MYQIAQEPSKLLERVQILHGLLRKNDMELCNGTFIERTNGSIPKRLKQRIPCPKCGRRFKPVMEDCGCGIECACYIDFYIPPHKPKKWWKKDKPNKKEKRCRK